jgi:hypothetical protein
VRRRPRRLHERDRWEVPSAECCRSSQVFFWFLRRRVPRNSYKIPDICRKANGKSQKPRSRLALAIGVPTPLAAGQGENISGPANMAASRPDRR